MYRLVLLTVLGASAMTVQTRLDRAEKALEQEQLDDAAVLLTGMPAGIARDHAARSCTLWARLDLARAREARAIRRVDCAVANGAPRQVHRLAAVAFARLHHWPEVLSRLDAANTAGEDGAHLILRAEALEALGRRTEAVAPLVQVAQEHPLHAKAVHQLALLWVRLGLPRQAVVLVTKQTPAVSQALFSALALEMIRADHLREAEQVLQLAMAAYPHHVAFSAERARVLAQLGQPHVATVMMMDAAQRDPAFAAEAVELARRHGMRASALMMTASVADERLRLRQRLAMHLDAAAFARAAALDPRLRRAGLLTDEEVRFALAFAHVQTGHPARAIELLAGIQDPALFERAVALRQRMALCQKQGTCP